MTTLSKNEELMKFIEAFFKAEIAPFLNKILDFISKKL